MLNTKKINLDITIPKKKAFEYETDPDLPQMHVNIGCVGKRSSGKTTAVVELIDRMEYDTIFLISPTLCSNYEMLTRLNIDPEDIFTKTQMI
jgi:hypothetical protein